MLVADVMQCMPNEVGELVHCVEFLIYNTPGPHGFSPRDVDRRWSLSTPLERELQPFQVSEFEPMEDYCREVFATYRELKVKVLAYLQSKSIERSDLKNRFRRNKTNRVGDKVIIRDQRQKKAGGRAPYKLPLHGPLVVKSLHLSLIHI